jgi:MSHA biogenesis protein MshP
MRSTDRHLRGFAIVSAIFILVVLAALGAFIVAISGDQQVGAALDVQGVQAYQAARSGIEWGVYRVQQSPTAASPYNFSYGTPTGAVGSADPNTRVCPGAVLPTAASTTSFAPTASALASFTITVTCTPTTDASGGPRIYVVQSTACNQPNAGACPNIVNPGSRYVERRLSVTF